MENSELEAVKKFIRYRKIGHLHFPNGLTAIDDIEFALEKAMNNEMTKFLIDYERLLPSSQIIK